ncbi:PAS domain-containing sensor histidine kinase [Hahella sp. CCB-MM4]|uniref:sensor histidine kinase n=1 Tax=Hahella sp. (strain CCB-MM4) TaxID=1926491 RepID=UPI000B9BA571|nr:ATP-binding protein [Hahella sp. CCB-MM4]OZG72893.1 PAS domain-containing sensor histidine kinase [Hahella sp. CCB-MM4]
MSLPKAVSADGAESNVAVLHSLKSYKGNMSVSSAGMPPEQEMDRAVALFDDIADEISSSYSELNGRISVLADELRILGRRRQAEFEEKEKLADRLSTLLKALPAGVVVLDARGTVQDCNPAAVGLLGEPLSGERWVDIIQRCFSPKADDGHEVSLKDGRRLNIQTCSLENGFGQLILLSDLTETRNLQSQLARNERLSAMGKMVASLAHQIRTPLSAAMLYAGHLASEEISPALRIKCATKLMSRLTHLEQQVRDMLVFAKGDSPIAERIRLAYLFEQTKQAAEAVRGPENLSIQWYTDGVEAELLCNKDAMIGALLNLINNACEALSTAENPLVEVHFSVPVQGFASIEVRDNGAGFEPGQAARLMDAFYTTKSNGTGLGLAVVNSVAQAHHGRFFIGSKGSGRGARAILTLPVSRRDGV